MAGHRSASPVGRNARINNLFHNYQATGNLSLCLHRANQLLPHLRHSSHTQKVQKMTIRMIENSEELLELESILFWASRIAAVRLLENKYAAVENQQNNLLPIISLLEY